MSSPFINLAISLGAMQVARKIPFDEPEVLNYIRIAYVVAQMIVLGVYYYVSAAVKRKNDQTVLKYVEPAGPMSQESGKLITTTYRDYDLQETSKLLRTAFMGIAMMGVMHLYFKFTQPLFIQSLMTLKNVYDAKLVQIYIFRKEAKDDLQRPFKSASMFGGADAGAKTDAASIAEAEKQLGKKDD